MSLSIISFVIAPLLEEIARLREENGRLTAARDAALAEAAQLKKLYEDLCHEYSKLRRRILGPKKERVAVDEAQASLFALLDALGRLENREEGAKENAEAVLKTLEAAAKKKKKKRNPHGRRDLSLFDLAIERIVLEPAERLVDGGELLQKIGEEVSEVIERREATLVRVQVVRPKYKLPKSPLANDAAANDSVVDEAPPPDTAIVIAPPLERPLPKCMAGPGLLAHVLVSKYADHIPLHRLQKMFGREGLILCRSTLGDWVRGCAELLVRVVDAMWEDAKTTAPWVATDATGILVLAKEQCVRVTFYVLVAARDHVLFGAVDKNDGESVADHLAGFGGRPMLSDASSVFHELHRREKLAGRAIIEAGCWSHARRGAFEALATDRDRALIVIGFIGLLYDVQRETTNVTTGVTDAAKRKELAAPIIKELYRYIDNERPLVEKGTPISKAFGYLINQKEPLTRFLDDGRLRLDNNLSELELRSEVVGRGNWLFCGSDRGVEWNTTIVSLIASCRLHDIEPWAYLRDVLSLLPGWSQERVLELAPKYWKATLAKPETQARLSQLRLFGRASPATATSVAMAS